MQASFSQNTQSKQNGDDADDQLHHQEQHQGSQQAVNQELNPAHNQRQQNEDQLSVTHDIGHYLEKVNTTHTQQPQLLTRLCKE